MFDVFDVFDHGDDALADPVPSLPAPALTTLPVTTLPVLALPVLALPTLEEFRSMSGWRRDEAYLRLERERRRIEAVQAAMLSDVVTSSSFLDDRHHSPRAWVAAVVNCSRRTANARVRSAAMLAENPVIAAANDAGEVGVDQLRNLADLHGNVRARPHLPEAQEAMVAVAQGLTARDFEGHCKRWLMGADPDGAHRDHELSRENRRASFRQVGAGFEFSAEGDALSGALFMEVLRAHFEAETDTDLAELVARYGDAAAKHPLPRTTAQRWFDALMAMCAKAAGTKDSTDREPMVNIHCTPADLADAFAALFGTAPPARDPNEPSVRMRLCETASGQQIDLLDLAVAALIGHVRRVVVDECGRVIDLGRSKRLFTGATREAVLLVGDRCCWPGCDIRTGRIQVDHITPWAGHFGRTASLNGAPLCGHHNRAKHTGSVSVVRDTAGWHFHRPDGTEIGRRDPHAI